MTETSVIEFESIEINEPLLFTGFTGPGLIGPTVLSYIVEQLDLKKVAYVKSSLFPPMTRIIKGVPQYPIRIYADKKSNALFMISDVFVQNEFTDSVGSRIFDWIKGIQVSEIISINGMAFIDIPKAQHVVFGYSTGDSKYLPPGRIQPLIDGVITGIDSIILHKSLESNTIWTTIMTTTSEISGLDPSAIMKTLETMKIVFNLDIKMDKIRKDFQRMRAR
jgi:predicted ATP-grasp superfamily ATP-dependent carboligase